MKKNIRSEIKPAAAASVPFISRSLRGRPAGRHEQTSSAVSRPYRFHPIRYWFRQRQKNWTPLARRTRATHARRQTGGDSVFGASLQYIHRDIPISINILFFWVRFPPRFVRKKQKKKKILFDNCLYTHAGVYIYILYDKRIKKKINIYYIRQKRSHETVPR